MCRLLLLLLLLLPLEELLLKRAFAELRLVCTMGLRQQDQTGKRFQSMLKALLGLPQEQQYRCCCLRSLMCCMMTPSHAVSSSVSHQGNGKPRKTTMLPSPVLCRLLPAAAVCKALPQASMHDQHHKCSS
jgi:hypothetical protein